jgi:hypothetical protein
MWVFLHTRVCVFTHTCLFGCMYVCMCVCLHPHMYVFVSLLTRAYLYVCNIRMYIYCVLISPPISFAM